MPKIYLETIRIKPNCFEIFQSIAIGYDVTEKNFCWKELDKRFYNDRLFVAIINLGYACRSIDKYYSDYSIKEIILMNDKDGKDYRNGGEHNILYDLLFPVNYDKAKKNRSLYSSYLKYLARIKELITINKISVTLSDDKAF